MYSEKIKQKLQTIVIRPGNLYGPYDKFDPEKAKVVPSLIQKFLSNKKEIIVWGDGKDIKDFMYVEDFCKIIIMITEKLNKSSVVNVASGKNINIREILEQLKKITKKNAKITFDTIYDFDNKSINLELTIDEGNQYFIRSINFYKWRSHCIFLYKLIGNFYYFIFTKFIQIKINYCNF